MITGKDLKRMLSLIPDDAVVTINGHPDVDIVQVKMETDWQGLQADLMLTPGYGITKDSVLEGMFRHPFKEAQTR